MSYAVHLEPQDVRALYNLAKASDYQRLAEAAALACPTVRNLTDDPCPCHKPTEATRVP